VTEGAQVHDTFTGTPLASLTLAQKLIELRIDHFERLSLSQSFAHNVTVFGWWGGLRVLVRKARLGRFGVAARIASLDAQVRDGIAAIEDDPDYARDTHYRGRGSVSQLHETLRAFDAESPEELALLRELLDEHLRELEQARAELAKSSPAQLASRPRAPWYNSALARALVPLVFIALPFIVSVVTSRVLLIKPRPEAPVLADAEIALSPERTLSKNPHPAARATAALHDVAALCNRATNLSLGHGGSDADLRATYARLIARVREATAAVADARASLRSMIDASGPIANGASEINSAWFVHVHRNTRQVERCTDERDSSGRTQRRCRTETVCDSKETTFSFAPERAAAGLRSFDQAVRGVAATAFDADGLFEAAATIRASNERGALALAQRDALGAESVEALSGAHRSLRPIVAPDGAPLSLEWIRSGYTNEQDFPRTTLVRSSCSVVAAGPRGYNAVRSFVVPISAAHDRLRSLEQRYAAAVSALNTIEVEALALSARSSRLRSAWSIDDASLALSDRSNALYSSFHRDSALVFNSSAARMGYAVLAWIVTAIVCGAVYGALRAHRRANAWKLSAQGAR